MFFLKKASNVTENGYITDIVLKKPPM